MSSDYILGTGKTFRTLNHAVGWLDMGLGSAGRDKAWHCPRGAQPAFLRQNKQARVLPTDEVERRERKGEETRLPAQLTG